MIRGYQTIHPLEPETRGLQWGPALGAGFVAGFVLLLVPRGSPWSSLTFFSPAIMGRTLPPDSSVPMILIWLLHLLLSIGYGLIISRAVAGLTQERAILAGGVAGLVLYLLNLAFVSLVYPEIRGTEGGVVFTHIVFGLIAAGAYRGLLRRKKELATPAE